MTKIQHPFATAHRLVRLMTRADDTGRRPYVPKGRVLELARASEEYGSLSRGLRGRVRAQLSVAYDIVMAPTPPTLSRETRLDMRLVRLALAAVDQLPAGAEPCSFDVVDRVPKERLTLVVGEWWLDYSRRAGRWHNTVAILTGYEDGQRWAKRVPPSTATVGEALDYLKPAAVKQAAESGRIVLRQGDVWLVERRRGADDMSAIRGTAHIYDPASRTVVHSQHGALALPDELAFRAYGSKSTTRSINKSLGID